MSLINCNEKYPNRECPNCETENVDVLEDKDDPDQEWVHISCNECKKQYVFDQDEGLLYDMSK